MSHGEWKKMDTSTILVVEDNSLNMKLFRSLLTMGGYQVMEAEDAEKGIILASLYLPDLILMDIQLPGIDGLEATRKIKKKPETQKIPVVALTSYAMPGDELKAREAGCSGYITKPINTRTFVESVRAYVNHPSPLGTRPGKEAFSLKKRILIVDDDPLNVKLLVSKLPGDQFEPVTAFSGQEALGKILKNPPDLILLDIMMPGMNGYEVSLWLKNNPATQDIPIILVTALDGVEDKIKGFEAGADEFLNKPVNTVELLARINSLLRLKGYREQLLSRTLAEKGFSIGQKSPDPSEEIWRLSKILLVEDNEKDARLIKEHFAGESYQMETVSNGEAALDLVKKEVFDLVLLDVMLPGVDGFEVCRQIKSLHQTQDLQVVLITCLPDLENRIKGVEQGTDDYLIKPINGRELKARVKVLLKKKQYIDKLRNNYERALGLAIYDGLTGLYNQTYFKNFLELEVKRAMRQRYSLGLMIMDIDDFKIINDRFGHLTGDLIIKNLAQLIKQNIREVDLSARYGGDEFVVVLPYTDQTETVKIIERLQLAVDQYRQSEEILLDQKPLTLSFGIALFSGQDTTMEELIRRADQALYRSKQEGKNRFNFYRDPSTSLLQ
jgi:two-component system cell cycle response regulator